MPPARNPRLVAIVPGLAMLLAAACGLDGANANLSGAGRYAPLARLATTGAGDSPVAWAGSKSRTVASAPACPAKTFPHVAQPTRDCFEANAERRSTITWMGDNESGTFTYERAAVRVETRYAYSPTSLDLTLTILEKPWIASCRVLNGRYFDGLVDCGY